MKAICSVLAAALFLCFVVADCSAQSRNSRSRRGSAQQKYNSSKIRLNPQQQTQSRSVSVPLTGSQEFRPPRTRGDNEFGGNGPVMNFRTRVYCNDGRRVYRQIFVSAYETTITGGIVSPPSSASGWSPPQLVYTAPPGWTVKTFRQTDHRFPEHFDRSHNSFTVATPAGTLRYYGDTRGDDIGRYTRASIFWRSSISILLTRKSGDVIK